MIAIDIIEGRRIVSLNLYMHKVQDEFGFSGEFFVLFSIVPSKYLNDNWFWNFKIYLKRYLKYQYNIFLVLNIGHHYKIKYINDIVKTHHTIVLNKKMNSF